MQFAHNGYYMGSIPLGLIYNLMSKKNYILYILLIKYY